LRYYDKWQETEKNTQRTLDWIINEEWITGIEFEEGDGPVHSNTGKLVTSFVEEKQRRIHVSNLY